MPTTLRRRSLTVAPWRHNGLADWRYVVPAKLPGNLCQHFTSEYRFGDNFMCRREIRGSTEFLDLTPSEVNSVVVSSQPQAEPVYTANSMQTQGISLRAIVSPYEQLAGGDTFYVVWTLNRSRNGYVIGNFTAVAGDGGFAIQEAGAGTLSFVTRGLTNGTAIAGLTDGQTILAMVAHTATVRRAYVYGFGYQETAGTVQLAGAAQAPPGYATRPVGISAPYSSAFNPSGIFNAFGRAPFALIREQMVADGDRIVRAMAARGVTVFGG